MGTFTAVKKTRGTIRLAQVAKKLTPASRQQLVDITLVSDIEDKLILRRTEYAMECDGEFDDSKIRTNVAAVFRGDLNQFSADFASKLWQLVSSERFDV